MIGSPKPVNLVVVIVGPSGLGKTACDDVAEDYLPADVVVYPLGTAEGTCQAFNPDDDGQPQQNNIIFSSSEIDNWAALGERAGSLTFPVLRQIVTGDQIGQKNASKAHTRIVAKRSYRAGISLSAQPGSNGVRVLFADAPGGFPQRCVFGPATDADAPDEPPTDIEPHVPADVADFTPNAGPYYEIPFPQSVTDEIRDHRRRVLRGDSSIDPLDGHKYLTRAKVAAGLMMLEGRAEVTEDDWRIAGRIMAMSDATRSALIRATEQAARAANRARAHASADRDDIMSDRRLMRAKQAVLRWLGKAVELSARDLRQKLKADIRNDFDAAIAELADDGLIHVIDVPKGKRYRIAAEGTRVPEVHPHNPQFSHGVPEGHGVPNATVTELDSRRSHAPEGPRLIAREWIDQHVAALLRAGQTTANSFAVYQAGETAGYTRQQLRVAVSDNPNITVIGRDGKTAIWDLTGTRTVRHRSAAAWTADYLNAFSAGEVVDKERFRHAATAAGYSWTAARHAATESGRIESLPGTGSETIWQIAPTNAEDAS